MLSQLSYIPTGRPPWNRRLGNGASPVKWLFRVLGQGSQQGGGIFHRSFKVWWIFSARLRPMPGKAASTSGEAARMASSEEKWSHSSLAV